MFTPDAAEHIPRWFANNGPHADCVIATRVRLARNLARHQFPSRASMLERRVIFEEVTGAVRRIPLCDTCTVLNFSKLEKINQQFLFENRAVSHDMLTGEGDRGVICDEESSLSIMVNEEDHVRLQCLGSGCQPDALWEKLNAVDDDLGNQVDYAFDARRGFLTSCPTNAGTGFRVSFLMHLPGLVLTKTIDSVLHGASQMGISTRGFFGEHSEVIGNFFQLSNQATIGADEKEFLTGSHEIITKILEHEYTAREKLLKHAKHELADKVFRSYGILKYAKTLALDEFINLSSALRTGIECGLFDRMTIEMLNRMILLGLPAHMELYYNKKIAEDERNSVRADLVKEFLPESEGV